MRTAQLRRMCLGEKAAQTKKQTTAIFNILIEPDAALVVKRARVPHTGGESVRGVESRGHQMKSLQRVQESGCHHTDLLLPAD